VPTWAGVVVTTIRRCTSARLPAGIARPNRTINGMPTPTTWPSPRKLVTPTSFDGCFITVNVLVAVPILSFVGVPVTETVYFLPHVSPRLGRHVLASRSRVPLTFVPLESLTTTDVWAGSSEVYLTVVMAPTPVAFGAGWVTATVLRFGAEEAVPAPPPCHDGPAPPQPALSSSVAAVSVATTTRHGRRLDVPPQVSMVPLTDGQSGAHLPP
jgi:hypothetical protein